MSQPRPCGRGTPRASIAGGGQDLAASIAGLPGSSACVATNPPLAVSGPRRGSTLTRSPDSALKPHVWPGNSRFEPPVVIGPTHCAPGALLAMIVLCTMVGPGVGIETPLVLEALRVMTPFVIVTVAPSLCPKPPSPWADELPLIATFVRVTVPSLRIAPPANEERLPVRVTPFRTAVEPRATSIPPPEL